MADYDHWPYYTRPLPAKFKTPPNLEVGSWIRWTTPERIWEGQVQRLEGCSMRVQFMGSIEELKTFPVIEGYFPPYGTGMEVIPKPRKADKIERDAKQGLMSVSRAAALLGVEPKRVRAMLRGGQLRGQQIDGKWRAVNGEDVMARLDYA